MNNRLKLKDRKLVISIFFIMITLIFVARLFFLQLLDDQSKVDAANNALKVLPEYAERGQIFDRNGKELVRNRSSYDLLVVPREVKGCDTAGICGILKISKEEFVLRIQKASVYPNSRRKESVFEKLIPADVFAALQEKMYRFKGFEIRKRSVREYVKPIAAHLLGYVGEVNPETVHKDPIYREGDYAGLSGIEKSYEKALRGRNGKRIVVRDVHNRIVGKFMSGAFDTAAVAGEPLFTSIDADLQAYGEMLMQGKKGAIVAIEPATGEILCLVSSPSYDPALLSFAKERSKNYADLSNDLEGLPLFNRALTAMYPPGSTFKLINALIAQHDGVIDRETTYPCKNGYPAGNGKPKCHTHPAANLVQSVAYSCNSYYSYVFRAIVDQQRFPDFTAGYNYWRGMVRSFGPGRALGADLPFDKPGNVPSVDYYNGKFGIHRWKSSHVVSLGIGQAELLLVPLQMANVAAIIANKGFYYVPHCVKKIGAGTNPNADFHRKHLVAVQGREYYDNIIEGMEQALEPGGTAWRSKVKGLVICGKTGTAQNPHGNSHSEFQAFAPKSEPRIAIACVIENAGDGGACAAPVASLMIEKYLTGKCSRQQMEKTISGLNLIKVQKPSRLAQR